MRLLLLRKGTELAKDLLLQEEGLLLSLPGRKLGSRSLFQHFIKSIQPNGVSIFDRSGKSDLQAVFLLP